MDFTVRHKRLRVLVKRLNQQRKQQAKKIDLLCRDLIAAQWDFIKRLQVISFAANFYQKILGTTEMGRLLRSAAHLLRAEIADVNVTFFLHRSDDFELCTFNGPDPITLNGRRFEDYFCTDLAQGIADANKPCVLDELYAMGLQGSLTDLAKVSAATMPLDDSGRSLGFILLYRSSQRPLSDDELAKAAVVAPGLSGAIQGCQVVADSPQ